MQTWLESLSWSELRRFPPRERWKLAQTQGPYPTRSLRTCSKVCRDIPGMIMVARSIEERTCAARADHPVRGKIGLLIHFARPAIGKDRPPFRTGSEAKTRRGDDPLGYRGQHA